LLKDFWVGEPGVGHVGLHAAGPPESLSCPATAGDGFVVLAATVTEGEIVHRSLSGSHHTETGKQQVANRLRGLHIACHHCGWRLGIQQRPLRNHQRERQEAAGVQRNGLIHQTTQDVKHRSLGDRQRGMEVVIPLGTGAAEIQRGAPLIPIHAHGEIQAGAVIQLHLKPPILKAIEQPTNDGSRMILNMLQITEQPGLTLDLQQLLQQIHPQTIGSRLGLQISPQQRRIPGRNGRLLQT